MSDPCFANVLNCTSYRTCQLQTQVDFIEKYLGISAGTTLPEVDNCTIGDANQLHLIAKDTTVAGKQQGHTGYLRNAIIGQYPCDMMGTQQTNFYLDLPFSDAGYGIAIGYGHNYPTTGNKRGSAILSGETNRIVSGAFSLICGGQNNTIVDTVSYATIVGGDGHTAGGQGSFIGGGHGHKTSGINSAVVGGQNNTITNTSNSFISAGQNNTITNTSNSFIGAGSGNTVGGTASFIGAGTNNNITSNHSFIGGGEFNTVNATHSVALGKNATVTTGHNNSFVFAGSTGSTSMASNSFTVGADLYYPGHGNSGATGQVLTTLDGTSKVMWGPILDSGSWTPTLGPGSSVVVSGGTGSVIQDTDPGHTNTGTYMRIGTIIQFSAIYYLKVSGASTFTSIDLTSNLPIGRTGPADMPGLVGTYILFDIPLENINQQIVSFRYFNPSTIQDNYSIKITSNPGYPPGITNGIQIGDGVPFSVFVNGQYTLV